MSGLMQRSREVRLKSRPAGEPSAETFEMAEVTLAAPGTGEVQVRNVWMSVDPYMRGRMFDRKSYVPPFRLGEALQGGAVGEVVASGDPGFHAGDLVESMCGWREGFTASAASLRKLPSLDLPPEAYLGVAGLPGLTAYVGLLEVSGVAPGEVVYVSAAAGAVGSAACQIARIKGARVIGSAGGEGSCRFLREIGVDAAIDYKAEPDLSAALARCAPDGVDVYFDNVGGAHLQAAIDRMKPHGRIALCGAISNYNVGAEAARVDLTAAVRRSLRLQGFVASDYMDRMATFREDAAGWIGEGRLGSRQTVEHGLDRAPAAFLKLFSGKPAGKMLVKL